jgi:AAA+ superfamily predicted ATPase
MPKSDFELLLGEFERALQDCQLLYQSSARLCIQQCPYLLPGSADSFSELMHDLHGGLLVKVYVTVAQADEKWVAAERRLAQSLIQHLWGGVPEAKLRDAAQQLFRDAERLNWCALVRPFQQFPPLRDRIAPLESLIARLANLVAKCDGQLTAGEVSRVRLVQHELASCLRATDNIGQSGLTPLQTSAGGSAQQIQVESLNLDEELTLAEPLDDLGGHRSAEERLAEASKTLDQLIGLRQVKHEIHTLTNFLKMQQRRSAAGLPQTKLSLHMVFGGNPGTGKTTVARIVGEIYGAMGILKVGHLVETDRGGLVAEYAGQTAPKTHQKVDEALDGVLFIDEAYSLVDESGDDPYGREALQTLLKRMEDARERLVVILAGYPAEMERLLRSNPGLSSRFNTHLTFEDYTPGELGRIFGRLCEQHHYQVPSATQARLLCGFKWLYDHRDDHFGNGRLVRNAFETAIRQLANRISTISTVSKDALMTLQVDDIRMSDVPREVWDSAGEMRFQIQCSGCGEVTTVQADFLGRRVKCNRCQHKFVAAWGEPVEAA